MDFRLLGPVEVWDEDGPLPLGGPKPRTLLVLLALSLDRVVPIERLIDGVWGEEPPVEARKTLRTYVSHLRRALGPDRLENLAGGYVLRGDEHELDVQRFERLVDRARRETDGDPEAALRSYRHALAEWRGPALDDLSDQASLRNEITRLEELRLAATGARIGLEIELGRHTEVVAELQQLVTEHPFREDLWQQLLVALYRSGRQAEALDAFQQVRSTLADELGIDPSSELQRIHEQVLRGDDDLRVTEPTVTGTPDRTGSVAIATGTTSPRAAAPRGPRTRYARSGTVNIAYQVVGDGPRDLVYVPGFVSNIEVMWEDPGLAGFLERLASFSRLIVFDKRGTGLSDRVRVEELPTLETRMDDLRAVMDAAGSRSATLFGHSEGGSIATLFAATYPERTDGLVVTGGFAKRIRSADYPWAPTREDRQARIEATERSWGEMTETDLAFYAPSRAGDQAFRNWCERYFRLSASPRAAAELLRMNTQIDVTSVLPSIHVPTLLLYRVGDKDVRIEEGRHIASRIPGARLVELAGGDHVFWAGDPDPLIDAIEEFVTGHRPTAAPDRVLATLLRTNVIRSGETGSALDGHAWHELLDRHDTVFRTELRQWRGREASNTDGRVFATFDGPARAIHCALGTSAKLAALGIDIRSGIHTGELEVVDDDFVGVAVHISERIAALAAPREVLVSRTVKDLVADAGFRFEDRGSHLLNPGSDEWQVYAVSDGH